MAAGSVGTTTIYVIDDDPQVRRLIVRMLQRFGHQEVTAFASVEEALEHMRYDASTNALENLPSVIVTDFDLGTGRKNGLDLLEIMQGHNVGLIMASTRVKQVQSAAHAWGAQFLGKPFEPQDFKQVVEQAVKDQLLSKLGIHPAEGRSRD